MTSTPRLRALIALPALGFAACLGWLAFLNVCYPVRPLIGMSGYDPRAWGGPSYAGVWAVHAAAGLAMPAVVFLITRPFVRRGRPR